MAQEPPAARSLTRRIATGTGWVIAWRLATRNLGLLSTLILVRLLDPSDFGLIALAAMFVNAVDALSALGAQDAVIREPSPDRDMYDTAFTMSVLRGAVTASIVAAGAWPCASFFKEPRLAVVLLALAAGILISAFENIGVLDFRRDMTFQKEFQLQIAGRVVGVVTTIAAAYFWRDYWALVAGLLTTRVVRLAQSYVMSPYRPKFMLRAWRRLIGFSLWTWALTILGQVRNGMDSFVVGRLMTTTDVATFTTGREIAYLPMTELLEPLHRTLFSAFVVAQQDAENPREMYLTVIEAGFLLLVPASIGISMVADPLVRLMLGERWVAAIPIVQILAAASTTSILALIGDAMNAAAGNLRTSFSLYCVSTAIRFPLSLFLVSTHGLPGAAVALGVSLAIDQLLFARATLARLEVSIWQLARRLWRTCCAGAAMVMFLYALGMAWTASGGTGTEAWISDILLRAGTGAAAYGAVAAAAWLAAGRPDGAERYLLRIATKWLRRFPVPGRSG